MGTPPEASSPAPQIYNRGGAPMVFILDGERFDPHGPLLKTFTDHCIHKRTLRLG